MSATEQLCPAASMLADGDRPQPAKSRVSFDAYAWPLSLTFISALLFLLNTRHGIGILPDSTRYLGVFEVPYDAPMYPWLLAAVCATGLSVDQAAELIGLGLACANTYLAWRLLIEATGRPGYAGSGTVLIILAPQFVGFHSTAMSEPLFFFFIFLSLLLLLRFWSSGNRAWLLGCSVAIGAAALTRFTAPPLGAAIVAGVLLNRREPLTRRIADALILFLLSSAIFFAWSFLSEMLVGHSLGREFALDGNVSEKTWHHSVASLSAWLTPGVIPGSIRRIFFGLFAGCSVLLVGWQVGRTWQVPAGTKIAGRWLPAVLALFFVFYLAFFLVAALIEANQTLTSRYALPIYVTTVVMITIVLAEAHGEKGYVGRLHGLMLAIAALVLVGHVLRTADRTHKAFVHGIGYASKAWIHSPTMLAVARLPSNVTIYSNGPDAITYVLRRSAHFIPMRELPRTGRPDPTDPFDKQIHDLSNDRTAGTKLFVFFDGVDWRFYLPSDADLKQRLPLQLIDRETDGRIYILKPPPLGDAKP